MPAEQSGLWLLERMRQQIGFESYAATKLLDFGCGVRFSQAVINTGFPIRRYVGIDCFAPMINFLCDNVKDPRFAYHLLNARHPLYNPHGEPLSRSTELPVREKDFDLICLFSVITHQSPADSDAIFHILRRHVAAGGHLFFTCFVDPDISSYEDRSPEQNGGRCVYNPEHLKDIVVRCGWRVDGTAPAEPPLIGDSFVYTPNGRS